MSHQSTSDSTVSPGWILELLSKTKCHGNDLISIIQQNEVTLYITSLISYSTLFYLRNSCEMSCITPILKTLIISIFITIMICNEQKAFTHKQLK